MLVLTRKPGEKIIVANHYQIEIAAVEHGVVKFIFHVDHPLILMPGNISLDVGFDGGLRAITVTRKVDDSVVIGEDPEQQVEILVVSVKGEAVRVGIKAPRDVQVHREEVWRLIQTQNIAAAEPASLDTAQLQALLGKMPRANGQAPAPEPPKKDNGDPGSGKDKDED